MHPAREPPPSPRSRTGLARSLGLLSLAWQARSIGAGNVAAWAPGDAAAWLEELGLGAHAPAFLRERIDGPALLELTGEELRAELGVAALGERKRILREAARLPGREDAASSARARGAGAPCSAACCDRAGGAGVGIGASASREHLSEPAKYGWGFDFGGNWLRFLGGLLEEESPFGIAEANSSAFSGVELRRIHGRTERFATLILEEFGLATLTGLTFLDIGSGHGLASLAAVHLNASRVVSMDLDARPVRELKLLAAQRAELLLQMRPWQTWDILDGSILDSDFVNSGKMPRADLVWSYGVLHHTGNLKLALRNVAKLVRPAGFVKIDIHTSEEVTFKEDWLEFKRDWHTRTNWYKEEALISYLFAELWPEMQERIMMDRLEEQFPGLAHSPGFFGRFEAVRHVVHSRFWHYAQGRGMDFLTDAVDWLGGYPYEMIRTDQILAELRAAEPSLKALHATFDGFVGLLLTPAPRGLKWAEATERAQDKVRHLLLHTPSALWFKSRTTLPVLPSAINGFSDFVEEHCDAVEPSFAMASHGAVCGEAFLSQVKGHACWITFFGFEGIGGDDMSLFHLLEDGDIMGWGAPNLTFCVPERGASYRFFNFGALLFTTADDSNPRHNGRTYEILAPA